MSISSNVLERGVQILRLGCRECCRKMQVPTLLVGRECVWVSYALLCFTTIVLYWKSTGHRFVLALWISKPIPFQGRRMYDDKLSSNMLKRCAFVLFNIFWYIYIYIISFFIALVFSRFIRCFFASDMQYRKYHMPITIFPWPAIFSILGVISFRSFPFSATGGGYTR